jgi:hypothetical protein
LQQVGGFLPVISVSSTNKTDCRNITEILLKVALTTITLTLSGLIMLFRFIGGGNWGNDTQ